MEDLVCLTLLLQCIFVTEVFRVSCIEFIGLLAGVVANFASSLVFLRGVNSPGAG